MRIVDQDFPTNIYRNILFYLFQIRHDNFPAFQSDWLLDHVTLERRRDGATFKFQCNCWLRRAHPYVTISKLPDPKSSNGNTEGNWSKSLKKTFVIILLILISIFIVGFCYYNRKLQERQREDDEQQRSSDLFNGINEYSAARTSCVNVDQNQSLPSRTERQSESHLYLLRRWKNFRDGRIARRNVQLSPPVQTQESMIIGVDPPPSYEELYPESTATNLSTNLHQ